jgi:hypothetical protein
MVEFRDRAVGLRGRMVEFRDRMVELRDRTVEPGQRAGRIGITPTANIQRLHSYGAVALPERY